LGEFRVSGFALSLADNGSLSVTGAVSASGIGIGEGVTAPTQITVDPTGSVAAPQIALAAGSGGIVLDSGASANLNGTANAIGTLDGFAVTGHGLSLSDTGALSVNGAVTASGVTIGGTAGTTPSGITLTGTGSIAAPLVTLTAGTSGIALNSGSALGQSGATVDLTSTGGINEVAGATLTAATLQSSGGISGGAADLNGTANAIGTLDGFAVTGAALSLSDTSGLSVNGAVTASSVTIGGAAGSTPIRRK